MKPAIIAVIISRSSRKLWVYA